MRFKSEIDTKRIKINSHVIIYIVMILTTRSMYG